MVVPPATPSYLCPLGHFCKEATTTPLPCPPGTRQNESGSDSCIICEAGSYCLQASVNPTGECLPGYYCMLGSTSQRQAACPGGTFMPEHGATREADCLACSAGTYCPAGSAFEIGCPRGSYCDPRAASPTLCPIGRFGNSTYATQREDCRLCLPGMYCDETGLTWPRGECDPGYFCVKGSPTSQPSFPGPPGWFESAAGYGPLTPVYGGLCPAGGFCPRGSTNP